MNFHRVQSIINSIDNKKKNLTGISLALLAIAAALINLWQSYRGVPLIDYAYQADAAYRIYQGEMPYRDFFLVLPPGIYYYMALIMSLSGGYNHLAQVFGTMLVSALTIMVSFGVIREITGSPSISLICTFPLILSGHAIYAFPNYDIAVCLFIMLTLLTGYFAQSSQKDSRVLGLISGITAAITALIKQNIGLPFILLWLGGLFFVFLISGKRRDMSFAIWSSIGVVMVIGAFLAWLAGSGALSSYFLQVFEFPSRVRNPLSGLNILRLELGSSIYFHQKELAGGIGLLTLIGLYSQIIQRYDQVDERNHTGLFLKKTFPIIVSLLVAFGLVYFFIVIPIGFAIPLLWLSLIITTIAAGLITVYKALKRKKLTYSTLIPFLCLAIFFFSSLSQGFWGSSYGIWPLYMIQFAWLIHACSRTNRNIPWQNLALIFAIFLSAFLFRSIQSQNRLWSYVDLSGRSNTSSLPELKHLYTPGDWLPNFENLIEYVNQEIPFTDSMAFLPGEDVFYIAANRVNPLMCNQFLDSTCDYTVRDAINLCKQNNIEWLILKNRFQLGGWRDFNQYPDMETDETYEYHDALDGYVIYKLRSQ